MSLSFLSATILQALHSTIGDGWIVHSCLVLFVLAGFILCFIEIIDYLGGNGGFDFVLFGLILFGLVNLYF